ncbi:hypothetical protein ACJ6WD_36975 [Streptomyces sp. VTCC 41912]
MTSAHGQLVDHPDKGGLSKDTTFQRIGFAHSEVSCDASRERYHSEARDNIQRMRDLFSPYASPSDTLRLLLEETWNPGASLLSVEGRKAFIGICRFQDQGVDLNPHTDPGTQSSLDGRTRAGRTALGQHLHQHPAHRRRTRTMGHRTWRARLQQAQGGRVWGLKRDQWGPPKAVIKPAPGDLLLLNPRQIHAVRPSSDEPRITLGHFIGYHGTDRPLTLWS